MREQRCLGACPIFGRGAQKLLNKYPIFSYPVAALHFENDQAQNSDNERGCTNFRLNANFAQCPFRNLTPGRPETVAYCLPCKYSQESTRPSHIHVKSFFPLFHRIWTQLFHFNFFFHSSFCISILSFPPYIVPIQIKRHENGKFLPCEPKKVLHEPGKRSVAISRPFFLFLNYMATSRLHLRVPLPFFFRGDLSQFIFVNFSLEFHGTRFLTMTTEECDTFDNGMHKGLIFGMQMVFFFELLAVSGFTFSLHIFPTCNLDGKGTFYE